MKKISDLLVKYAALPLAIGLFRLIALTYRFREVPMPGLSPYQGKTENFIYGFFHCQLLSMIYYYRNTKMGSIASLSKDGELAARIASHFGITMVRGSSSRGGVGALLGLQELTRQGYDIAITVDGPRGPAESVNNGVIYLAKLTGIKVVPAAFACDKSVRMRSWDRFQLPLPFSRGVFALGEPVFVPRDLKDEDMGIYKEKIRLGIVQANKMCEQALAGK